MQKERHANQFEIFNPWTDAKKIVMIWAGGIGSTTAYLLAQMWFSDITVVDFDEVENHNVASQFYKTNQVGSPKVEALRDNVLEFTGVEIKAINEKYKPEHTAGADIVILAVDNMDVRKEIVDTCEAKLAIIDWRMWGEVYMTYAFDPAIEKERWLETWFPQSEAAHENCTAKSISYNCAGIACRITKLTKDISKWRKYPFEMLMDLWNFYLDK